MFVVWNVNILVVIGNETSVMREDVSVHSRRPFLQSFNCEPSRKTLLWSKRQAITILIITEIKVLCTFHPELVKSALQSEPQPLK